MVNSGKNKKRSITKIKNCELFAEKAILAKEMTEQEQERVKSGNEETRVIGIIPL